MTTTPFSSTSHTVATTESPAPHSTISPENKSKSPKPKGGRVSAMDGGGTGRQNDRRRDLREFFAEQFYLARRNPKLAFKNAVQLGAHFGVDEHQKKMPAIVR